MRIAYLSTFYPFRGGIAQFNASLYRALEKNHQVKAFTFTCQYPEILFPGKTQMIENDETADAIPSQRILNSVNPLSYINTAKSINAFKPDILLMKYWMTFLAPSLGTAARLINNRTRVVTVLDNVIPHERKFYDNSLTKYFLNQNDGFVAMSDAVMNDLNSLQANPNCLRMDHPLYNHFGAKTDREKACKELAIDSNKKNLLFFGFIRDYKGLDLLIEAMKHLDSDYNLIIAGECYGSFDKYQELINNSPFKNSIHVFTDYIPDSKVPVFFSAADVCILPYKSATQSGITSIAYHFEVPVIATDVGGLKESITHESTGLIVPRAESSKIADAIKYFFRNDLTSRMKHDIIQLKEKHSWDRFAEGIVNFATSISKK
ncbi:MAG: glycosyltransferase [Bacteroidetes bacterium]|nr:glycosyltransferase [Bacteroidota bacterium]